jgi:hypothetical protein
MVLSLHDVATPCDQTFFTDFPSPMPKGLRAFMLPYIHQFSENFMTTLKLDGIRVLIHFDKTSEKVYIIDRLLRSFEIPMYTFPSALIGDTTIDGELIRIESNNTPLFFAFDMIKYNGIDVTLSPLKTRYGMLQDLPRLQLGIIRVYIKRFYDLYQRGFYAENVPLSHIAITSDDAIDIMFPVDGMILMDVTKPNDGQFHLDFLKWKPNPTIDVLMYTSDVSTHRPPTYFWEFDPRTKRKQKRLFRDCYLPKECDDIKSQIAMSRHRMVCVECQFDTVNKKWYIIGVRSDKKRANSSKAIYDTLEIINENIHETVFTCKKPVTTYWLIEAWSQNKRYELECRLQYDKRTSMSTTYFYRMLAHCHTRFITYETIHCTDYLANDVRTTVIDENNIIVIRKDRHFTEGCHLVEKWSMNMVLSSETPIAGKRERITTTDTRKKHRTRFLHRPLALYIDFTVVLNQSKETTFEVEFELCHEYSTLPNKGEIVHFIKSIL